MPGNGCMYQLLPIKYELKLPSEVTPGLLPFKSRSKQCEWYWTVTQVYLFFSGCMKAASMKNCTIFITQMRLPKMVGE